MRHASCVNHCRKVCSLHACLFKPAASKTHMASRPLCNLCCWMPLVISRQCRLHALRRPNNAQQLHELAQDLRLSRHTHTVHLVGWVGMVNPLQAEARCLHFTSFIFSMRSSTRGHMAALCQNLAWQ